MKEQRCSDDLFRLLVMKSSLPYSSRCRDIGAYHWKQRVFTGLVTCPVCLMQGLDPGVDSERSGGGRGGRLGHGRRAERRYWPQEGAAGRGRPLRRRRHRYGRRPERLCSHSWLVLLLMQILLIMIKKAVRPKGCTTGQNVFS